jgi:hypothetical protein
MLETINYDVEVKELFDKVTVEIPGGEGLRAINLEGFKIAVDRMMMKGFVRGGQEVLSSAEDVINRVFNKQK